MKEKNYIIGMSNNEISKKYMEITIPEIKRVTLNDEVNFWEGTTPETLPVNGPLKFGKTKPTMMTPFEKEMSPTEKAVWYSHYRLWNHIITEDYNCWVFEHDVNLERINILITPPDNMHIMTASCVGCLECYYITPQAAKLLINYAETEEVRYQVDTFMYYMMLSRKKVKIISYSQNLPINQLKMFGTTIDHRPSSATYPHQE